MVLLCSGGLRSSNLLLLGEIQPRDRIRSVIFLTGVKLRSNVLIAAARSLGSAPPQRDHRCG